MDILAPESSSTQEVVPDPSQDRLLTLSERLAAEMAQNWRDGRKVYAHELFRQHPALLDCREAAFRLICEEVCLTQEAGLNPSLADLAGRFPQWTTQIQRFLECQELLREDVEPPPIGDVLGDFQVVCELGQGALGRVVLARQISLSNRPVVLKITPRKGQEHLSLARLQHTHIAPLYGVHDDAGKDQRVLCMPFFGTLTLHEVLSALHSKPAAARTGRDLVDLLDRAQSKVAIELPGQGPFRAALGQWSYVRAICWLGKCVADALQYAHERGLVHLDLKPSNVLLADDGQPMLLDFHLARPPIAPDGPRPTGVGGTPQYMSPEQRALVTSLCEKKPILLPVDGRSDVYSLGLILYQLLGGSLPLPKQVSLLDRYNPAVSPGVADIIQKCLAEHPGARYQTAGALADDLHRHLTYRPLAGVRNRSWRERVRKWQIRNPRRAPLIQVAAALTIILAMGSAILYSNRQARIHDRWASLEEMLSSARKDIEDRRFQPALARLQAAQRLAADTPGTEELAHQFQQQLELAKRGQTVTELHQLADRIRYRANDLNRTRGDKDLIDGCRKLWEERGRILAAFAGADEPDLRQARLDLVDVAVIMADQRVRLVDKAGRAAAQRAALATLAEAEAALGVSPVFFQERYRYASALGMTKEAEQASQALQERPPRTAWECYTLGRSYMEDGDLDRAAKLLEQAVARDPHDFWANFYQGICAYRGQNYVLAVNAFRAAVTLRPNNAIAYYNRALAYSKIPELEKAVADYGHALKLDPNLADAALNRGVLYLKENRLEQALRDLNHALAKGSDPAVTHFNLALVYAAQHNRPAALANVRAALRADPENRDARRLEKKLAAAP